MIFHNTLTQECYLQVRKPQTGNLIGFNVYGNVLWGKTHNIDINLIIIFNAIFKDFHKCNY
jgi:hypothetical protein